jgi:hypothetical protein
MTYKPQWRSGVARNEVAFSHCRDEAAPVKGSQHDVDEQRQLIGAHLSRGRLGHAFGRTSPAPTRSSRHIADVSAPFWRRVLEALHALGHQGGRSVRRP